MAITYTSNSNIPNDTVAFKNFLYQVFLANELGGNASTAYQLSPPATPTSGWTFGYPQYDLSAGTQADLFQTILQNYADNYAGTIPPEDQVAVLVAAASDKGNLNSLTPDQQKWINSALSSNDGQTLINNSLDGWFDHLISDANAAALGSAADQPFLQSNLGMLFLCDYDNQLGITSNGPLAQYIQGNPVTLMPGTAPVQKDGPLDLGNLLQYYFRTQQAAELPWDPLRRIANVVSVAGGYTPSSLSDALDTLRAYTHLYKGNETVFSSSTHAAILSNFIADVVAPADETVVPWIKETYGVTPGPNFVDGHLFVGADNNGTFSTVLSADAGDDVLIAGAGSYILNGASGNDLLIASAGQDSLYAGCGADTLIGGAGNDTLYAGSGADTFDYASSSDTGIETIVLPDPSGSGSALGSVEVGASALTGGTASQTAPFTWTGNSTSYVFTPGAGNPSVGTLTVSGGALGTGDGEIVLQNFNLNAAMSGSGELGIALGSPVARSAGPGATAGPFASGDYVADGVTTTAPGSVGQALTVSLSATSDTAQRVTVSLIASMKAKAAAMMLPALLLLWTPALLLVPPPALAASPDFPFSYHFTLTKGTGIPVCEADLKRLNTATYSGPPGCDQPQTTSIPGFAPLHRVFLSPREVHTLLPRVTQFMATGVQGSRAQDEAFAAERKKLGLSPTWTLDEIKGYMRLGYIKVWRYDPPVDIDNDGRSTSLVIWQGVPLGGVPGVCGKAAPIGYAVYYDQPQVAFVVDRSGNRLSVSETKAIFGHPGTYRLPNGKALPQFQPIGMSIGIFEYRDLYYSDTFFGRWFATSDQRFLSYPAPTHTLGVFLRQHGKTRQLCQYHMTVHHAHSSE